MRTIAGTAWRVEDAQQYIHDRTMIVPWSGCWLWERALNNGGYGYGHAPGPTAQGEARMFKAHRLAYEAFVGPIPRGSGWHGTVVMHVCDVRACCNPDHLRLGTQRDNVADMHCKRRAHVPRCRGERHGHAKLTREQVVAIREEYAGGGVSQSALGAKYGVEQSLVSQIVRRVIWTHL